MLQKTLGIVLHTLKYKDTSLIADIYTAVSYTHLTLPTN